MFDGMYSSCREAGGARALATFEIPTTPVSALPHPPVPQVRSLALVPSSGFLASSFPTGMPKYGNPHELRHLRPPQTISSNFKICPNKCLRPTVQDVPGHLFSELFLNLTHYGLCEPPKFEGLRSVRAQARSLEPRSSSKPKALSEATPSPSHVLKISALGQGHHSTLQNRSNHTSTSTKQGQVANVRAGLLVWLLRLHEISCALWRNQPAQPTCLSAKQCLR